MSRRNRANGEGTIRFSDQDGRWHGWIDMGTTDGGRRDRRHVASRDCKEVVAALRDLASKRDAGVIPSAGRSPTLAEWATYYLDHVASSRVRPTTLASYRWLFVSHILPAIGHQRLDRLQPEHVELVHARMHQQDLAPATVLHAHRVLSRCLKVAWQRGRMARNVAQMVDAPSLDHREVEPLTRDEARLILDTAAGRRNAARWSVALALGLRQDEALGLQWHDIDLAAGTLTMLRALQRRTAQHGCGGTCHAKRGADCPQRIGGGLVLVEPKSRAGRRTIAMPPQLVDALRAHRAAQHRERLTAGTEWVD